MQESNLFQEVPIGFAMELAKRPKAMARYGQLSPVQQAELRRRAHRVHSRQEMEQLADSLNF